MITNNKKLLKNEKGSILCEKHIITASSICLEENCLNIINCINCNLIDKHCHLKNVNIYNILDENIDDQIFNEKKNLSEEKIKRIKLKIKKMKKQILDNFDFVEKQIVDKIQKEKNDLVLEKKREFQKKRKEYLEDDLNMIKLKKLAEEFIDFSKMKNEKKKLNCENKISQIQNNVNLFIKSIKKQYQIITKKYLNNPKK